jgi:DNA-directed RNA polymerase specialized sigma24 family protein
VSKTWSRKRKAQPQQVELDELRDGGEQHREAGAGVAEDGPEAGALAEEIDESVARAINALPRDSKMALLLIAQAALRGVFSHLSAA